MCPHCRVDVQIIGLHPPEVGLAPEESEDWGDK